MATPTNTIQIGQQQPNTGAPTGGKIPFGVTDQGGADEKFIAITFFKRGTSTAISTGTVYNINSLETTVGAQEKSSTDAAGQTGNTVYHDEYLEIQVTYQPQGSTLGNDLNTGALLGAYLPPPGSYCAISNAPKVNDGYVDGSEPLGAGDAAGDAYNSKHWKVMPGARRTVPADGYWGNVVTLRRYKTKSQWNPN